MPYQGLADGLYLVMQRSPGKAIDHYGILDIGNRLAVGGADGINPVALCANVTWNTCLPEFTLQGSITHGSSTGLFDEPRSVHPQSGHPGRSPKGE